MSKICDARPSIQGNFRMDTLETILWSLRVQGLPYPQLVHLLSSIFQLEISIGGSCSPLCLSPPSMV